MRLADAMWRFPSATDFVFVVIMTRARCLPAQNVSLCNSNPTRRRRHKKEQSQRKSSWHEIVEFVLMASHGQVSKVVWASLSLPNTLALRMCMCSALIYFFALLLLFSFHRFALRFASFSRHSIFASQKKVFQSRARFVDIFYWFFSSPRLAHTLQDVEGQLPSYISCLKITKLLLASSCSMSDGLEQLLLGVEAWKHFASSASPTESLNLRREELSIKLLGNLFLQSTLTKAGEFNCKHLWRLCTLGEASTPQNLQKNEWKVFANCTSGGSMAHLTTSDS